MTISEIVIESKLILKFIYKEIGFSMAVDIIKKENGFLVITAILENDIPVDPKNLSNVELVYIVKDGLYTFQACKLEPTECFSMRAYMITSDENVNKVNRREVYRVFIGEITKIKVISQQGVKTELEGILKDISIQGMGVIFNREIEIGYKISIIYNYEGLNIHLLGEVIRADKVPGRNYYAYGCKFFNPNSLVNRVIMLKQMKTIQRHVLEPDEE